MKRTDLDRRQFIQALGLAGASLSLLPTCGGSQGAGGVDAGEGASDGRPDLALPAETSFSVVLLPDTQIYAQQRPEIYLAQTRWIAENRKREKIVFVSHLGDVVNNGPDLEQWKNAKQAMAVLDAADVPYGVCLGNHDLQYSTAEYAYGDEVDSSCGPQDDFDCSAQHFLDNFGPGVFSGRSWYGGASPSGTSSYQVVETQGVQLVFLHLCLDQRRSDQRWAQQVLDQHPDALVQLTTHRYLYDFRLVQGMPYPLNTLTGGRYVDSIYGLDAGLHFDDGMAADTCFTELVAKNPQICMVHCGHVDGEYRQSSANEAGLPVHEMMVDFQTFSPARSEGWLRLLSFDLSARKVYVRTYSPLLDTFRENGAGFAASCEALKIGMQMFKDLLDVLFDPETLQAQLDYWTEDPAGQKEYYDLLYGAGRRDSSFSLELDPSRRRTADPSDGAR